MNYKVTLAMPVYNVEKYVERALLSALNQTFDSIEFLIVDDKGTDRSMEIVSEIVSWSKQSCSCGSGLPCRLSLPQGRRKAAGTAADTGLPAEV